MMFLKNVWISRIERLTVQKLKFLDQFTLTLILISFLETIFNRFLTVFFLRETKDGFGDSGLLCISTP